MQRWKSALAIGLLALSPLLANAAAIQPFEADSLAQIVAGHKGKPFVLVVWSLDCTFCQASFNTLAQEKRRRQNLNVVTLSTDALGDPQAAAMIRSKLQAAGMTADAWAFGAAPAEQLRYAIDPKWRGEMPRSYWFDARGERVAYSGVITPATVRKMLDGS